MKKLIVFDMDGVLVDVSSSYRDVTRKSAYVFLRSCRGSELLPDPLFSLEELAAVKQSGGLNNDWDMTFHVISLLLSMADTSGDSLEKWDVSELASFLKNSDKPLIQLMERGELCEKCRMFYNGDVGTGNLIKEIFQEIYLGKELYEKTYGIKASHFLCDGYILKEKLFVSRGVLEKLADGNILAVATGRPGSEALYPLKKNGLSMFSAVCSLDDCIREENKIYRETGKIVSLSKPSPFMLDALAEKYKCEKNIYVGDMGDDMKAAKNSKFPYKGVGVVYSAPDRKISEQKLLECGSDVLVYTPDELISKIND